MKAMSTTAVSARSRRATPVKQRDEDEFEDEDEEDESEDDSDDDDDSDSGGLGFLGFNNNEPLREVYDDYTPAELRPGQLLLIEFSRFRDPSYYTDESLEFDEEDSNKKKRRKRPMTDVDNFAEHWGHRIVNLAYVKLGKKFAPTPWGYFCEEDQFDSVYKVLRKVRKMAQKVNQAVIMQKNSRRLRIEAYPIRLDPDNMMFRKRVGEFIANRLIELRNSYTTKTMWTFRKAYGKARFLDHLVLPGSEQAKLIRKALVATAAQRDVMIAIHGEKVPNAFYNPGTGGLREEIQLDFTDIDRAIKLFRPLWTSPSDQ